jgi:HSP20 family protein
MTVVKFDPLREMDRMLDRYSRNYVAHHGFGLELMAGGDWIPRVDIVECEKSYVIKLEVPEVDKQDVKIEVEYGVLKVTGERKREKEETGKTFHVVECSYGSFCRSFALPKDVDETKIEAIFKDGMLTVEVPKHVEPKSKPIEVKVH